MEHNALYYGTFFCILIDWVDVNNARLMNPQILFLQIVETCNGVQECDATQA